MDYPWHPVEGFMKPRNEQVAKSEAVATLSDYREIGVVADLFGLPEVAPVVSGFSG
jgi:hypothetical protein